MENKQLRELEFEGKKYTVRVPSSRDSQEANKVYAIKFTECLKDGLMTKEQLKEFLIKSGVWSKEDDEKEKDYARKINEIERDLFTGGGSSKRVSIKDGVDKSFEIKRLRKEYTKLIVERQSYEANTAESLADNSRFDYLVSACCFNEDGSKVYNNYEDYLSKSSTDVAYNLAETLAEILFSVDMNLQDKLPENQFLKMFNLVDDDMRLIDKEGNLVDKEGRRINEQGFYIDEDGGRIDKDGNKLTEDGLFDLSVVYTDEDGNEIVPSKEKEEEIEEQQETVETPDSEKDSVQS